MKITTIAQTFLTGSLPEAVQFTEFGDRFTSEFYGASGDADLLVEFAGRACYQSWNLPNAKTAENKGYVENILRQQHYSVLEHASVTFYVEGVSRALTHELIRHRHLSYSELSQRYVDVADAEVVIPPALRDNQGGRLVETAADVTADLYLNLVDRLANEGVPRKQAREAARAVMPNAIETKIVVTGNLRAWRDFLGKRWHVAADAEIRELAGEILKQLRRIAPASVSDIPEAPFQ